MIGKAIRALILSLVFATFAAGCTTIPRTPEPPARKVCDHALEKMRNAGVVVAAGGTHFGLFAAANFLASAAPGVNAYYLATGLILNIAGEVELSANKDVWRRENCDAMG